MRIKGWLMISYVLVMLLPVIAGIGLYAALVHFHQEQEMADYFQQFEQLNDIREVLNNPTLYEGTTDFKELEALLAENLEINLYSKEGYLIYTTNPFERVLIYKTPYAELYADLYQFDYTYHTYFYKEPVLQQSNIVGLYEVKMARSAWIQQSNTIYKIVAICFVIVLTLILFVVMRKVQQKIIEPLNQLIMNFKFFPLTKEVIEIHSVHDEIGDLHHHFREMQLQILKSEEKVKQQQLEKEMMIASISHDLKTPLTSIRAFAESIERKPEKSLQHAPVIIEKAEYIQRMLDDLLLFSVLQSPEYKLKKQLVEGEEFFDMLFADYDALMKEKQLKLTIINHAKGELELDVDALVRVADNLVTNAIKFTPPLGNIRLIASHSPQAEILFPFTRKATEKKGFYFIVENEGEGIDRDEIKRIFNPLYQVDASRSKVQHSGTGLGLTIAKQILEKHGGSIQVISEINIGTAVICYWPERGTR